MSAFALHSAAPATAGVFSDLQPAPDLAAVLRGQGADPARIVAQAADRREVAPRARWARARRVLDTATEAIAIGRRLIAPHVAWAWVPVWRRRAPILAAQLGEGPELRDADTLLVMAVTIGPMLEQTARLLVRKDVAAAAALDSYGSVATQQLGTAACDRWRDWAATEAWTCSLPISPGRAEWPVAIGQPELFALLADAHPRITLNEAGHMDPLKSVSFVLGLSRAACGETHPRRSEPADPCLACLVRARCQWRTKGLHCRLETMGCST